MFYFVRMSVKGHSKSFCQFVHQSQIMEMKLGFKGFFFIFFQPISSPTMHQSFAIPALSTASSSSAGAGKPSVGSGATSSQNVAAMQHSALKRLQMVKKKAQQRVLNHQQIRIPRR